MRSRFVVLALTLALLAFGASATIGGVAGDVLTADPFAPACSFDALGYLSLTPFAPVCPAVNDAGCSFTDIVCSGSNCCCIYSCAEGSSTGPCWRTGPLWPVAAR